MGEFQTKPLGKAADDTAPDGSEVRLLLGLGGGGMAHFKLGPSQVSRAVTHRTVEEIWYFLSGRGQMWRKSGAQEETVDVFEGVCITIPLGTRFQFRADHDGPLSAVGVTMPPWPGGDEAVPVDGPWVPSS